MTFGARVPDPPEIVGGRRVLLRHDWGVRQRDSLPHGARRRLSATGALPKGAWRRPVSCVEAVQIGRGSDVRLHREV